MDIKLSKRRGFTLIELMVVIAIIGILASIITASLVTSEAKGRDAKRIADIRTLQLALEQYYNDHGAYPVDLFSGLTPTYLPNLPTDPSSANACTQAQQSGCYAYNSFSAVSSNCFANPIVKYHLGASLEASNSLNNAPLFNQAANWSDVSPYVWCKNNGSTGNSNAFIYNSNPCGYLSAGNPPYPDCYDVTN